MYLWPIPDSIYDKNMKQTYSSLIWADGAFNNHDTMSFHQHPYPRPLKKYSNMPTDTCNNQQINLLTSFPPTAFDWKQNKKLPPKNCLFEEDLWAQTPVLV